MCGTIALVLSATASLVFVVLGMALSFALGGGGLVSVVPDMVLSFALGGGGLA